MPLEEPGGRRHIDATCEPTSSWLATMKKAYPPITLKGLEPDLACVRTLEEEMVDRFDGLAAHRTSAVILEAMSPTMLHHPTTIEERKPHEEAE
jgi:hypothetical protein